MLTSQLWMTIEEKSLYWPLVSKAGNFPLSISRRPFLFNQLFGPRAPSHLGRAWF
jgi:hypothetical protein